jgi:hypothetical protein
MIDRRELLVAAGAAMLVGCGRKRRDRDDVPTATGLTALTQALTETKGLRALGRDWLQANDSPPYEEVLARLQLAAGARADNERQARKLLQDRIREDYRTGKLTALQGWQLSESEALLCGAVAAHRDSAKGSKR